MTEPQMHTRSVKSGIMKFDPTITTGNIVSIVTAVVLVSVGWGMLSAKQAATDNTVAAQRVELMNAISDLRDSTREQRADLKELQKSVNSITTDTALIRGRLAGNDSPTGRK